MIRQSEDFQAIRELSDNQRIRKSQAQMFREPDSQTTRQSDNQTIRGPDNQWTRQSKDQTIRRPDDQWTRQLGDQSIRKLGNKIISSDNRWSSNLITRQLGDPAIRWLIRQSENWKSSQSDSPTFVLFTIDLFNTSPPGEIREFTTKISAWQRNLISIYLLHLKSVLDRCKRRLHAFLTIFN